MSLYWLVNVVLSEIQHHSVCFLKIFLQDNGWIRQTLALPDFVWNEQGESVAPQKLRVSKGAI